MKLLKRLFCKHENKECITNFYGDCINAMSTRKRIHRSAWECKDCGKIVYSEYLEPSCKVVNWNIMKG